MLNHFVLYLGFLVNINTSRVTLLVTVNLIVINSSDPVKISIPVLVRTLSSVDSREDIERKLRTIGMQSEGAYIDESTLEVL